jgi:eukaryotic-like serine/threonine-protein kinase
VTQVGEGQEASESAPQVMTFGAPTVGEILAERYELAEHINNDSAGRQVWRGVDVVLRRPVAVVLRYPGGDSALEMLQAAVAASRVIHPSLVGVYDAIDEAERAYVVREWVDGESLREIVAEEPLDPTRTTTVAHAIADAVAAMHATGMVHGNIHPGTVLIGDDGRVVLADARADNADTQDTDVRAIGAILYFALTGHWPHAEAGRSALPDAVRDASGSVAAPRQIRAGVPAYLDDLTMDLLDSRLALPAADVLAAELGRLDSAGDEPYYEEAGPLRFLSGPRGDVGAAVDPGGVRPEPQRATIRKIAAGVAGLLAIAVAGLLFGISALGDGDGDNTAASPSNAPATGGGDPSTGGGVTGQPKNFAISANQVRIVDPPDGERNELDDADLVVDGNENTGWEPNGYKSADFGNLKPGMGILIDLGQPRTVSSVQVTLSDSGVSAELRAGNTDPGSSAAGDDQVAKSYKRVGEPFEAFDATKMSFTDFDPDQKYQYLLFFITEMPRTGDDPYPFKVGVQEIVVAGLG